MGAVMSVMCYLRWLPPVCLVSVFVVSYCSVRDARDRLVSVHNATCALMCR